LTPKVSDYLTLGATVISLNAARPSFQLNDSGQVFDSLDEVAAFVDHDDVDGIEVSHAPEASRQVSFGVGRRGRQSTSDWSSTVQIRKWCLFNMLRNRDWRVALQ